jgi:hypothetical protein
LICQRSEVLLSSLKRGNFFACRPLKIHRKPERPDKEPGDSGRNILTDLGAFFGTEFLNLLVITSDLGCDRQAVRIMILRLNDGDGLRRSSRASAQRHYHRAACSSCHWGSHPFLVFSPRLSNGREK